MGFEDDMQDYYEIQTEISNHQRKIKDEMLGAKRKSAQNFSKKTHPNGANNT